MVIIPNKVIVQTTDKSSYVEPNGHRALKHSYKHPKMTIEFCKDVADGARYFGLEYGDECWSVFCLSGHVWHMLTLAGSATPSTLALTRAWTSAGYLARALVPILVGIEIY